MDDDVWRPSHLTSEQMEERRLAGATLLRQGRLSQAQIARKLGVSRASVCRWAATLAQEGPHGLEARPIPGRVPRSMRRLGLVWVGSWTGVPWRPALPPSAGRSNALPP